jgi:hypothetical protein
VDISPVMAGYSAAVGPIHLEGDQVTGEEVRGRLVVLEVFCISALGIIFALTGQDDSKHQKALATLNGLKEATKRRLGEANDPVIVAPGEAYLDELLSAISENLRLLRPKPKES